MGFLSAHRVIVVFLLALCLGFAVPAAAVDSYADPLAPSAAEMAIDVAVVRPLSLAATIVGTGVFIVSLPFSLLGHNVGQANDKLILAPLAYTFDRPLGDFEAVHRNAVPVGD